MSKEKVEELSFHFPDSTEFLNPFRPHRYDHFEPTGNIEDFSNMKLPGRRNRPFIQQVLMYCPRISVVKSFPITEGFVVGSFNSLFIAGPKKTQINVKFPEQKRCMIESIDIHPSEVILACDGPENNVRIVSLPNGEIKSNINKHSQNVSSIMFAPSFNKLISTSLDGSLIVSDFVKEKCCYKYEKFLNNNPITTSVIRDDESLIVIGLSNGNLGIFDERDDIVTQVEAHTDWVNSIDIASQKYHKSLYFVSSSLEKDVKIWDLRNLEKPVLSKILDNNVCKVMFSDDDSVFGICSNGTLSKLCYQESIPSSSFNLQANGVTKADLHSELRRILYSSDESILSAFYF